MGDLVKIATKTALIAIVMAIIVAAFVWIQVPRLDFTWLVSGLGTAAAIIYHYVPGADYLLPMVGVLLSANLGFLTLDWALRTYRWIMKVNE